MSNCSWIPNPVSTAERELLFTLTSQMYPSKSHLDLTLKFYRGRSFGFHGGIDSVVRLVPRLIYLLFLKGAEAPFE
jgi:hypothetical protein